jgi:predicted membrane-bound spermidine synthase
MESPPVAGLLLLDVMLLVSMLARAETRNRLESVLVAILFFGSGFPALVYQIVWQRALFVIYGVNVQSVAVVVSAFMLGLGIGSLAGGALSCRFPRHGIVIFGICELGIAIFGLSSLRIFQWAAGYTAGASLGYTVLFSFLLLSIPTMMMGATLPLLVEELVGSSRNVGYSVATLYFVNTLGSAVACYICAQVLLRGFGQSGSVTMAACINLIVGTTAYLYGRSRQKETLPGPAIMVTQPLDSRPILPLSMAVLLAGVAGFIALGFEIEWFRVLALGSSDRAPAFALLLSTYLSGIAAGSYLTEKLTAKMRCTTVFNILGLLLLGAGAISVYLPPLVAQLSFKNKPLMNSAPLFFITAGMLGSVLPLVCRLAVAADHESGRRVSLIYVSNILGSTVGSLVVGFVVMDHFGLPQVAFQLGILSAASGTLVLLFATRRDGSFFAGKLAIVPFAIAAIFFSTHFYANLFGRLIFGPKAAEVGYLAHVVENRSGVIAVTQNGAVMGGGVYDGAFNIDPVNDVNGVLRAYAISLFVPSPKRILMIGLSSGSWAQILANHPQTDALDVVEINPGYLPLIEQYAATRSLLRHPKVRIYIDDGRRWLLAHPHAHYDLIVANTSYYWRDHSSNLLSCDFLRLVQSHLNPGGFFYYNATGSADVMATGLHVFLYGVRVLNFLMVSDSPIIPDKQRWFQVLEAYAIDGKRVFDPTNSRTQIVLTAYNLLPDTLYQPPRAVGLEAGGVLAARVGPRHIITDDNMGAEWGKEFSADWR